VTCEVYGAGSFVIYFFSGSDGYEFVFFDKDWSFSVYGCVVALAVNSFWLLFTFFVVVVVNGFRAVFACRVILLAARLGVFKAKQFFTWHRAWYVYFIANKHIFRMIDKIKG